MSEPILQLLDQNNWSQIFDESREAVAASPAGGFFPIPAYEIPFQLDNQILAVRTLNSSARASWKYGGTLIQRISAPITGISSPPVEAQLTAMRVNRTRLVIFRRLTDSYELVLEVPAWFKNYRLTIWEYTGTVGDSTESLINTVQLDVTDIKNFLIT